MERWGNVDILFVDIGSPFSLESCTLIELSICCTYCVHACVSHEIVGVGGGVLDMKHCIKKYENLIFVGSGNTMQDGKAEQNLLLYFFAE